MTLLSSFTDLNFHEGIIRRLFRSNYKNVTKNLVETTKKNGIRS